MMNIDTIIFDLDGTLWSPLAGTIQAWHNVLSRFPGLRGPISGQEIAAYLGYNTEDIADRLFPDVDRDLRGRLMRECSREEKKVLGATGGALFPGVEDTLKYLAERYQLAIVSNCDCGYIECFLTAHRLWSRFCGFECYGNTGRSKGENILAVMKRLQSGKAIYVGDMILDQQAAQAAGIPFVFAAYGFAESCTRPQIWDYRICAFPQLIDIVENKTPR